MEYFSEDQINKLILNYPAWQSMKTEDREELLIAKYKDGKQIERLTEGGWCVESGFGAIINPYASYRVKKDQMVMLQFRDGNDYKRANFIVDEKTGNVIFYIEHNGEPEDRDILSKEKAFERMMAVILYEKNVEIL